METIWVAAIGALSVVGVAWAGAWVQIRTADRRSRDEREQREIENARAAAEAEQAEERARTDARYERALAFLDALSERAGYPVIDDPGANTRAWTAWEESAYAARMPFLATLDPTDGGIARYTARAVEHVKGLEWGGGRALALAVISETVYRYLRGELSSEDLDGLDIANQDRDAIAHLS